MDGLLIKNVNDILFAIDAFVVSDFRTFSKVRCLYIYNYKFALKYSVIFVTRCALSGPYTLWS
jgi:hypothetical protein